MKKILIAGYPELTENYKAALHALGACPVSSLHVPDTSRYDGLILPGGDDIDPRLFGQLNHGSRSIDPVLDRIQLAILQGFIWDKKPVLGICKGMQLINVYFGGDTCQHLPTYQQHQYDGQDRIHETVTRRGSFLYDLYGEVFTVNSAHHQGIDTPGQGICCIQSCRDGVTEGFVHSYLPVTGVQWHPERMCFSHKRNDTVDGSLLLEAFLNSCSYRQSSVK